MYCWHMGKRVQLLITFMAEVTLEKEAGQREKPRHRWETVWAKIGWNNWELILLFCTNCVQALGYGCLHHAQLLYFVLICWYHSFYFCIQRFGVVTKQICLRLLHDEAQCCTYIHTYSTCIHTKTYTHIHRVISTSNTCPRAPPLPEDEDEEHEQHTESGHVVHSLHQHHQLPPQRRHEPHQLNDPQQPERPQHWQAAVCLADDLAHTGMCVRREVGRCGGIKRRKKKWKLVLKKNAYCCNRGNVGRGRF